MLFNYASYWYFLFVDDSKRDFTYFLFCFKDASSFLAWEFFFIANEYGLATLFYYANNPVVFLTPCFIFLLETFLGFGLNS